MDVLTYTDATAFAEQVGPVIDRDPAFTSVLATNLDQSRHGPALRTRWFLIRDGGDPVGAAMHSQLFPLFITPIVDADAGVSALADAVSRNGPQPSAVTGPAPIARAFAEAWQHRTGAPSRLVGTDRLYEIDTPPSVPVTGSARLATEADLELACAWTEEFTAEALPDEPVDAEQVIRRRLTRGRLLFWHPISPAGPADPVSMAGVSRPIAGVSRIGAVYTPVAFRRRGFGSAVTAAATRQGFDDGAERCILYADLSNPTSNRIYQALGYRPIGDSARIGLG